RGEEFFHLFSFQILRSGVGFSFNVPRPEKKSSRSDAKKRNGEFLEKYPENLTLLGLQYLTNDQKTDII
ncbi:MAG: hypothetical protein ACI4UF_11645, partial [Thermoguttaceae bacterium]